MDPMQANGIIRINQNNTLGFVCAQFFTPADARVMCRELGRVKGYNYTDGVPYTPRPNVEGPYFATLSNCTGSEEYYGECKSTKVVCSGVDAAAVLCYSRGSECKFGSLFTKGREPANCWILSFDLVDLMSQQIYARL